MGVWAAETQSLDKYTDPGRRKTEQEAVSAFQEFLLFSRKYLTNTFIYIIFGICYVLFNHQSKTKERFGAQQVTNQSLRRLVTTNAPVGGKLVKLFKLQYLAGGIIFVVLSAVNAETVAPQDVTLNGISIDTPLTDVPGNPASGREIFVDRKLGNCLACHANSDLKDQLFHGNVGPNLDAAGSRWTEGQLRTILVNAKAIFTDRTVMPSFYSLDVGADVREDLVGKTILEAQQIEDLVAYIQTLK